MNKKKEFYNYKKTMNLLIISYKKNKKNYNKNKNKIKSKNSNKMNIIINML